MRRNVPRKWPIKTNRVMPLYSIALCNGAAGWPRYQKSYPSDLWVHPGNFALPPFEALTSLIARPRRALRLAHRVGAIELVVKFDIHLISRETRMGGLPADRPRKLTNRAMIGFGL